LATPEAFTDDQEVPDERAEYNAYLLYDLHSRDCLPCARGDCRIGKLLHDRWKAAEAEQREAGV
jgi:hypothetical protein